MKINDLESYVNENIDKDEDDKFYNESFCNIVFDYVSMMGEFNHNDKVYLESKGYDYTDFYHYI